jgi:von Willebrand factor type A domain
MREITSTRIAGLVLSVSLIVLALVVPVARSQTPPPPSSETSKAKEVDKANDKEPAKAAPVAKVSKKSRTKPGDEIPLVMSSEALAKARGKGVDQGRYDGEPDWALIPPWRQASFFGVKAQGQLIIYVVDCSGSMDDEDRLDRAKTELRRSVNAMQAPQRFKVIFYNDRPVPMPGELPKSADYLAKDQLSRWLHMVQPFGGTDPRGSLSLALAYRPDAIFLLSDGDFPDGTVESVAKLNSKKVPIHCIDLANGAAGDGLRKIAAESGGQYVAKGR